MWCRYLGILKCILKSVANWEWGSEMSMISWNTLCERVFSPRLFQINLQSNLRLSHLFVTYLMAKRMLYLGSLTEEALEKSARRMKKDEKVRNRHSGQTASTKTWLKYVRRAEAVAVLSNLVIGGWGWAAKPCVCESDKDQFTKHIHIFTSTRGQCSHVFLSAWPALGGCIPTQTKRDCSNHCQHLSVCSR